MALMVAVAALVATIIMLANFLIRCWLDARSAYHVCNYIGTKLPVIINERVSCAVRLHF